MGGSDVTVSWPLPVLPFASGGDDGLPPPTTGGTMKFCPPSTQTSESVRKSKTFFFRTLLAQVFCHSRNLVNTGQFWISAFCFKYLIFSFESRIQFSHLQLPNSMFMLWLFLVKRNKSCEKWIKEGKQYWRSMALIRIEREKQISRILSSAPASARCAHYKLCKIRLN